jgi:hypothetical protein
MLEGLISGKLFGKPVERTAASGKTYVTAKVRVQAGDESVFANVIAFAGSAKDPGSSHFRKSKSCR